MKKALLAAAILLLATSAGSPVQAEEEAPAAPLQWPLEGRFLQGYGWGHRGIDIGAPHGTPIGAAAEGWVTEVSYQWGYGLYAVVDHGDGLCTLYSHLSGAEVEPGQPLGAGDVVGWVGMTGYATTPHLHFEVHLHGVKSNPFAFLP